MKVFVAGTFWSGDVGLHLRRAVKLAEAIVCAGHLPCLPQLFYFWHLMSPKKPLAWEGLWLAWLAECDAVIFVRGTSKKYRLKIYEACQQLGKPLYNSFGQFEAGQLYRWPGKKASGGAKG